MFKSALKRGYFRGSYTDHNVPKGDLSMVYRMLTIEEGSSFIRDLVTSHKPFFVGRNGTIELQVIDFWNRFRMNGKSYPAVFKDTLQKNAGIFPATEDSLDAWCKEYVEGLALLEITAAGWYKPLEAVEDKMLGICAPKAARCPLRSLEPYYVGADLQWTAGLAGKKVCVVSSFAHTMQTQVKKNIWPGGLLPKNVEWSFVRTGYSPALAAGHASCNWPYPIRTWQEAVDYVVGEVIKSGAELSLIGCGGLGMIIGARLKARGISAIVLGGAIQILFGIKGKRWATHDVISKFWNEEWVWPSADEVPAWSVLVEGGCYW